MTHLLSVLAVCLVVLMSWPHGAAASWTLQHQVSAPLNAVAFGGDQFVVVGQNGRVLTSTTGRVWTERPIPEARSVALVGVAFGEGRWVVAAETGEVLTSDDGVEWTWRAKVIASRVSALKYGNGTFVAIAGGAFWNSTNGIDWTSARVAGPIHDGILAFGNGQFLAASAGPALSPWIHQVSTNGIHWEARPASSSAPRIYAVGFGDGTFLTIDHRNQTHTSTDIQTWTPGGTVASLRAQQIAHGLGVFVVAGSGAPDWSSSGQFWTRLGSNNGSLTRGVAFGADSFVSVRFDGAILWAATWFTARTTSPGSLQITGPGGSRCRIEASSSLQVPVVWDPVGEVEVQNHAVSWTDSRAEGATIQFYRVVNAR